MDNKTIPLVRLKDGNIGYDCDIFAGDNVDFTSLEELRISGNLSAGNNFKAFDLYLGGSGFFGANAETLNVVADEDIFFDDYADVSDVTVGGFALFGSNAYTGTVVSGAGAFFGPWHHVIY